MTHRQYSDWSSDPASTTHGSQSSVERIVWTEVDDNNNQIDQKKTSFAWCWCFKCCFIGSLLVGIGLAIVLTFWLRSKTEASGAFIVTTSYSNSSSSLSVSTTFVTSSNTPSESTSISTSFNAPSAATLPSSATATTSAGLSTSASTSTSTTSSSTSTSTATSTTTTAFNSCNNLRWNQTGQIVAGTTTHGSSASQLNNPSCLYIDNNNTLYICDHDNNRIQKWIQGGTTGVTVAGSSTGSHGSTSALLNNPIDLTFDQNGFMYVVDNGNNRVQRFAPGSTSGTTVAGTNGSHSSALTDLNQPTAIITDNNSNIYILDMNNKRLVEWTPNATHGTVVISDSSLNNIYDILFVPNTSNQVYMSNQGSNNIYVWTFGASSLSETFQTVNDSQNTLNNQMGMVLDPYGNLYVADRDNDRVVMFCANSTVGIVVAEDGSSGPSLKKPVALAFDSDLNLYLLTIDSDQVVKLPRI